MNQVEADALAEVITRATGASAWATKLFEGSNRGKPFDDPSVPWVVGTDWGVMFTAEDWLRSPFNPQQTTRERD